MRGPDHDFVAVQARARGGYLAECRCAVDLLVRAGKRMYRQTPASAWTPQAPLHVERAR